MPVCEHNRVEDGENVSLHTPIQYTAIYVRVSVSAATAGHIFLMSVCLDALPFRCVLTAQCIKTALCTAGRRERSLALSKRETGVLQHDQIKHSIIPFFLQVAFIGTLLHWISMKLYLKSNDCIDQRVGKLPEIAMGQNNVVPFSSEVC